MTPERERELRDRHAAAKTHRELATIEAELWLELRSDARDRGVDIGHPVSAIGDFLPTSKSAVEARRRMFLVSDLADPLWSLVEGDLTLNSAVELLKRAAALRVPPETLSQALRRAIQEYYDRPYQREVGDGKVIRFSEQRRGVGASGRTIGRPGRPRAASNGRERDKDEGSVELWRSLRDMCLEHAQKRLLELAPEDAADLVRALETDLKIAFEQFYAKVRRAQTQTSMRAELSRRQVTAACRTLLLDPPRSLRDVSSDFRAKAQRQFKSLARQYHPDSHGGAEETRERFEAVVAAWGVLQDFFRTGITHKEDVP